MNDESTRYFEMFRDRELAEDTITKIRKSAAGDYTFMEVCGGHTAAIHRFGIPSLLPDCVRLVSGPGCPVCVTEISFIDKLLCYASRKDVIIATFGDLLRVPGSSSSLAVARSEGNANVRLIVSSLDALEIAEKNKDKNIIFPAIGFETTAPGTAVTVKLARKKGVRNFFILSSHKIMPPALRSILSSGTKLNGFICPGHVAAITGASMFRFIPEEYGVGCVVTGFEPVDILHSVLMLIQQVNRGIPVVQNQYLRVVTDEGNLIAQREMQEVFETCDTVWRGFGSIAQSGLRLRDGYVSFDAEKVFPEVSVQRNDDKGCICGEILRGFRKPVDCPLYGTVCKPENPAGACMVSAEGACNIYYKYN